VADDGIASQQERRVPDVVNCTKKEYSFDIADHFAHQGLLPLSYNRITQLAGDET